MERIHKGQEVEIKECPCCKNNSARVIEQTYIQYIQCIDCGIRTDDFKHNQTDNMFASWNTRN